MCCCLQVAGEPLHVARDLQAQQAQQRSRHSRKCIERNRFRAHVTHAGVRAGPGRQRCLGCSSPQRTPRCHPLVWNASAPPLPPPHTHTCHGASPNTQGHTGAIQPFWPLPSAPPPSQSHHRHTYHNSQRSIAQRSVPRPISNCTTAHHIKHSVAQHSAQSHRVQGHLYRPQLKGHVLGVSPQLV